MTAASSPLLAVEGLRKHFPAARGGVVKALEDVSFTVPRRKIVGLVGESGSGKTTAGRCVLRLIEPTAGRVAFDGVELAGLGPRDMLALNFELVLLDRARVIEQPPDQRALAVVDAAERDEAQHASVLDREIAQLQK